MDNTVVDPIASLLAAGEGKYEWVRGNVEEVAPPSYDHDQTRGFLDRILGTFADQMDAGTVVGEQYFEKLNASIVRAPDLAFFKKSSVDRIKPVFSDGGADLIIEVVSPSSRSRDRGDKFYEYESAGVEEYWIVDHERKRAEFYRLRDGAYETVLPDDGGKIYSSVLAGFFLRVEWLWDRPKVLDALRELGLIP